MLLHATPLTHALYVIYLHSTKITLHDRKFKTFSIFLFIFLKTQYPNVLDFYLHKVETL